MISARHGVELAVSPHPAATAGTTMPTIPFRWSRELRLELIETLDGLESMEAEWRKLFSLHAGSAQVFQSYDWCRSWCSAYLDEHPRGTRLAIVAGWTEGRLVVLWPLVMQRHGGIRQLLFLGQPVSQYSDVLVEDGPGSADLLDRSWEFIIATLRPDLIRFCKVREDAVLMGLLSNVPARRLQDASAPYVDFGVLRSADEFDARYDAKHRKNRRRLARRLSEQGQVVFERAATPERAAELTATALAMKRRWLVESGRYSTALIDARTERFFAEASRQQAHRGAEGEVEGVALDVTALLLDGAPLSIMVAVACKDRLAGHVFTYDLAHRKSGAGVLLLEHCLRRALADGYRVYDLLAPADSYKRDWCSNAVGVADWVAPQTLTGRIYAHLYVGGLHQAVRALLPRLPLWLRKIVLSRQAAGVDNASTTAANAG